MRYETKKLSEVSNQEWFVGNWHDCIAPNFVLDPLILDEVKSKSIGLTFNCVQIVRLSYHNILPGKKIDEGFLNVPISFSITTLITMYAFRIVFRRVLYDALEWKRTKSKQKQPNQLIILSFIKAISGLCCSVQTTVDHFLFRSAAVLPDNLCTNSNQ